MKKIVIPLPSYGFDPTEAALPWKLLSENTMEIVFATPEGNKASADILMLTGGKLGVWKSVLRARQDAVDAYYEMEKTESFCNPLKYNDVKEGNVDAILLPGGHDKGVKEYIESKVLQRLVADFFTAKKPVGAICHGVVLAARSINPDTGKSVIHTRKTTSLLKSQELLAYNLTRLWLKDYYLTYPGMTVEDEVRSVLADGGNFLKGPTPLLRDSHNHPERGFVVRDGNYLSARWPGDAVSFSLEFIRMVQDAGRFKATTV
ncbi:MAG: type 1 glutamine amidotransferase domain-containing protein [Desulfosalsimonadaceae bacterium]|nr:type 1 glutamine amidotransferase domain-containing protein [Desulfosalsimonadaceae bacterium]